MFILSLKYNKIIDGYSTIYCTIELVPSFSSISWDRTPLFSPIASWVGPLSYIYSIGKQTVGQTDRLKDFLVAVVQPTASQSVNNIVWHCISDYLSLLNERRNYTDPHMTDLHYILLRQSSRSPKSVFGTYVAAYASQ